MFKFTVRLLIWLLVFSLVSLIILSVSDIHDLHFLNHLEQYQKQSVGMFFWGLFNGFMIFNLGWVVEELPMMRSEKNDN